MSHDLPQLDGSLFLTDGGFETTLIFHDKIDLPEFAAFPLLDSGAGRDAMEKYFNEYLAIARRDGRGIILETPTWRSNPDWGSKLGYSATELDRINQAAVAFIRGLDSMGIDKPVLVSGNIGPRGDGYLVGETMTANEAAAYHRPQIQSFADAGADMITALTMTYADEAAGIVLEATEVGLPVVAGLTVETNGDLPSGESLAAAIERVDGVTRGGPAYYMINCAHPTHFLHVLSTEGPWDRIRGIRSNASKMSHEELDNAEELDRGDEAELAAYYEQLAELLPGLAVVGGCCGTDHHHIDRISSTLDLTA